MLKKIFKIGNIGVQKMFNLPILTFQNYLGLPIIIFPREEKFERFPRSPYEQLVQRVNTNIPNNNHRYSKFGIVCEEIHEHSIPDLDGNCSKYSVLYWKIHSEKQGVPSHCYFVNSPVHPIIESKNCDTWNPGILEQFHNLEAILTGEVAEDIFIKKKMPEKGLLLPA